MRIMVPVVVLLVLYLSALQAQEKFVKAESWNHIGHFAAIDNLGNIYSLEAGVLHRQGTMSGTLSYSNAAYGPVTYIDVSDPLNILVFHGDFGQLVFLDRYLLPKQTVNPSALHDQPQRVCYAAQDGFWAWYPGLFQLARHSKRGQTEAITPDLRFDLPGFGQVDFLQEKDGKLFVAANGIWVFDLFANFLFHIPHIHTSAFQVIDDKIYYLAGDNLIIYNFFLQQETVILLPEKGVNAFYIMGNAFYLQTEGGLKKFHFTGNFY